MLGLQYTGLALKHWKKWRPKAYRQMQEDGTLNEASANREQGSREAGGGTDGSGISTARGRRGGAAGNNSSAAGKRRLEEQAEDEPALFWQSASVDIQDASPVNIPALDFIIDDTLALGKGTEAQKYQDNLAAIRTIKEIEAANRRAFPDEQRVLARYVGWGGLKNAFRIAGAGEGEGIAQGWESRVAELEALLTPAELKAARYSVTAAHYTSQSVVQAMWRAAERLGFAGGSVLEPAVGTGNFIGLMPENSTRKVERLRRRVRQPHRTHCQGPLPECRYPAFRATGRPASP